MPRAVCAGSFGAAFAKYLWPLVYAFYTTIFNCILLLFLFIEAHLISSFFALHAANLAISKGL